MMQSHPIDEQAIDTVFRKARTHSRWQDRPVPEETIRAIYDLARMGPTAANCCPARFVFVTSAEGKARLKPHLDSGNVDKTMAAPVTVIMAMDMEFYEHLPKLFPHADARSWYVGRDALIEETAFRNASLQAAYLMIAARALGLDCGPMSGFDVQGVQDAFFTGTRHRPNFLCNLGYGDPEGLHPRLPRLDFDEVCRVE